MAGAPAWTRESPPGLGGAARALGAVCRGAPLRAGGSNAGGPAAVPGAGLALLPAALGLLRALCGYVLLFTGTATLLYVEQARIVAASSSDARERTLLFARLDLAVNATTLALQACVARRAPARRPPRRCRCCRSSRPGFVALARAPRSCWPRRTCRATLRRGAPGRGRCSPLERDQKYARRRWWTAWSTGVETPWPPGSPACRPRRSSPGRAAASGF